MAKLVIAVLLVSVTAWADKYTRQQNVKIEVTLSERAKPLPPKAAAPTARPITADAALALEARRMTYHADQEAILLKLIATTPDSEVDEKADLYFRLGELYARQQRLQRLRAGEAAIANDRAKEAAAAEQAKQYLLKAVKAYKALTDTDAFRNYPKMDLVLFYYGFTLQGGKYMKEARAVYDKLLKNYPSSRYVPEAHLAFADYHWEQGQLADAEARYKLVLKFPKSSVYWYALYKLGWIHLNLGRFQEALETFFQVAQGTKLDAKQDTLHRAAKHDFVRAYAEIGKSEKAFDAFKRVDQKYAFTMLATLADLYLEQGKSDKGIYVYRELMKIAPRDKNVCAWQYNVAHLTLSMQGASNNDKVTEIENLNRLWAALARKQVLPKAEAQDCHDNAAAMSGELARAFHSEAARTQNPETLAYAEKLYKVYLDTFPDAEDYARTRYYYAELLWSRAKAETKPRLRADLWERAALAFGDAIKTGKLDAKLLKESAYAAVLAWIEAVGTDRQDDKTMDKKIEARPIPAREQKMLAAFDFYIRNVPNPDEDVRVGIKFLTGNFYRRYGHYAQAIPIFEEIIDKHPTHETAEFAANLLLDTYNVLENEPALIALVDKLLTNTKIMTGRDDLAKRLKDLKRTAQIRGANKLRRAKDYASLVECGLAFLDIYNRDPLAKDNDEILFAAGSCFEDGRSIDAAIRMYNLLERYFPKSKLAARAIARLGKAYGDIAFYEQAAEQLELYAKKYAGEKDAYDALSDAVTFRKGIGDDAKAIDDTKYFVRTFGTSKPADAANAAFSLTSIYEKQGNADAVIRHLREYIRVHGAKGGRDKLVIAHARIGQLLFEQSCPIKGADGMCVKIVRSRAVAKVQSRTRAQQPQQCGPESKIKLTIVERDSRKVHEALAEFAAASRELTLSEPVRRSAAAPARGTAGPGLLGPAAPRARTGEPTTKDSGEARHFVALGKLAEADVELERYLGAKFPANLDFDPSNKAMRQKSLARFDEWFAQKRKLGDTAKGKYEAVLAIKDNAASIAAAARIGQIAQNFSDALFTAEIPKDLRTGPYSTEKVEAYCDKLTETAEPLESKALEAYDICLHKSTELGWFSDWSRLCERELGQIRPDKYPTASELRGESNFVARLITIEPPANW